MEADLYEEINGMIQLYLIRHSMTAGNLKKRYIGRTDESLCPEGIVLLESYIQKNMPYCLRAQGGLASLPLRRILQKMNIGLIF